MRHRPEVQDLIRIGRIQSAILGVYHRTCGLRTVSRTATSRPMVSRPIKMKNGQPFSGGSQIRASRVRTKFQPTCLSARDDFRPGYRPSTSLPVEVAKRTWTVVKSSSIRSKITSNNRTSFTPMVPRSNRSTLWALSPSKENRSIVKRKLRLANLAREIQIVPDSATKIARMGNKRPRLKRTIIDKIRKINNVKKKSVRLILHRRPRRRVDAEGRDRCLCEHSHQEWNRMLAITKASEKILAHRPLL